jgi:two-component sensor histidine kinase
LSGRLSIKWETKADMLQMVWEERDGPVVEKPVSRGFGTRSVIASIESQLGGQAEFDWRSEGLVCRLSVPLKRDLPSRQLHHPENLTVNGKGAELASRAADA